jgi:hypothetical protein
MRDKMVLDRRKLRSDELHNFYSSSDIIRMMKSRRMTWAGHVEYVREKRNPYRILVGKPEEKKSLGRPRRVRIILKLILEKWDGMGWDGMGWDGLDSLGSGQGPVESSCEHSNGASGSIKYWEVLE